MLEAACSLPGRRGRIGLNQGSRYQPYARAVSSTTDPHATGYPPPMNEHIDIFSGYAKLFCRLGSCVPVLHKIKNILLSTICQIWGLCAAVSAALISRRILPASSLASHIVSVGRLIDWRPRGKRSRAFSRRGMIFAQITQCSSGSSAPTP